MKLGIIVALAFALPARATSQIAVAARPFDYPPSLCASCAEWNVPHAPLRIFGNTWYVGTNALGAILVTSPQGHVLIDGGIPASAPQIIANIRALGFLVEDVRLIVNSHVHHDHAGGIAELQRASGADIAASPASAPVLRTGKVSRNDPQYGLVLDYAPSVRVKTITDGETLRVGPLSITAHFTPGHTPGGTSWSWRSCEGTECHDVVYADSQSPISADGFFFTRSKDYPDGIADFKHGHAVLEQLSCDILLTPHPSASSLWERIDARTRGSGPPLVDASACKRLAATARAALAKRIQTENTAP